MQREHVSSMDELKTRLTQYLTTGFQFTDNTISTGEGYTRYPSFVRSWPAEGVALGAQHKELDGVTLFFEGKVTESDVSELRNLGVRWN